MTNEYYNVCIDAEKNRFDFGKTIKFYNSIRQLTIEMKIAYTDIIDQRYLVRFIYKSK